MVAVIYSTLGPAQALAGVLRDHNLLRISIAIVPLLLVAIVAVRWADERPGRYEVGSVCL